MDTPNSDAVIINAEEYCSAKNRQTQTFARPKTQQDKVTGWMFSWSTQWMCENGGFIQCVIEDYGVGLLALSQGKQILGSTDNV